MTLLLLAVAPVLIIAFYIYFRDKYEKEPISLLLISLIIGGVIIIPIVIIDYIIGFIIPVLPDSFIPAYKSFITAGLVEEGFKFLAVYLLIWKNKNFNEKFDGIVYAVFISLGFALVENILYVFQGGLKTGLLRAFTAVPLHATVGIIMGFYFGLARFIPQQRISLLLKALMIPVIFHGVYDYCILSKNTLLLVMWIPLIVYLLVNGFKKMKILSHASALQASNKSEQPIIP